MKHEQAMQNEINTIFLNRKNLTLTLKYKYAKSRRKCEWVDTEEELVDLKREPKNLVRASCMHRLHLHPYDSTTC